MRRLVFMSLGMMVGVLGQFEAPWPALLVSLLALGGLWAVATRLVAALWFWAGVLAAFLCLAGARPGPEPESRERGWGGILQVTGTSVSGGADTVWQARLAGLVGRSQCALSRSGGSLLRAGDLWLGRATVSPPAGADNPHSFDYRSHLRRRGVVWQARFDRVILLQSGRGPAAWGAALVAHWHSRVARLLDGRGMRYSYRGILMALLTGNQRQLHSGTRELLSAAGMAHLVAISGLHLGCFVLLVEHFLGLCCFLVVRRRRSRATIAGGLLAATWFLVVSGVPMSALRAYVMLCGYGAARWWGKDYDLWSWLGVASLVILAAQPGSLIEAGFQLSTLAVAGIAVAFSGARGDETPAGAMARWMKSIVRASAGAFAGTLGATWWHFGVVAWAAVLVNVLAVPIVSLWVLPLGLCGAFLPSGAAAARSFLINECAQALELMEWWAMQGGSWTGAGPWPGLLPVAAGSGLLLLAVRRGRWLRRSVALVVGLLLLWAPLVPSGRDGFSIHVLAVGDGDAMVIGLPCGRWWLVDGGPARAGKQVLVPILQREGIDRVERVFVTHGHADHFGGLLELPKGLAVCEVWTNGTDAGRAAGAMISKRHSGCGTERPRVMVATSGLSGEECGVELEVLWPPDDLDGCSQNDNSLVLRISYAGQSLLLTGDFEGRGVEAGVLAQLAKGPWLMVKVPHHGRPAPFMRALGVAGGAAHAVVSRGNRQHAGEGAWSYGHGVREGFWWATGIHGQIQLFHDGSKWRTTLFRLRKTF